MILRETGEMFVSSRANSNSLKKIKASSDDQSNPPIEIVTEKRFLSNGFLDLKMRSNPLEGWEPLCLELRHAHAEPRNKSCKT